MNTICPHSLLPSQKEASEGSGFQAIYADPPWKLGGSGKGSPPYTTMAIHDICALPVERLAAPDCALLCGLFLLTCPIPWP